MCRLHYVETFEARPCVGGARGSRTRTPLGTKERARSGRAPESREGIKPSRAVLQTALLSENRLTPRARRPRERSR